MRKLTIGTVLILTMAVVFSMNTVAQTSDDITPAEENICDFLKADGTIKGLYGLCVAYCEAHDGPADIVDLTEEEAKKLDPASFTLFDLYERKRGVDGPELPCVNYEGPCPIWTQEELDRIGTLGGSNLGDSENSSGSDENYFDLEWDIGFIHYAQVIRSGDYYLGRYGSQGTGYPDDLRMMELTADEYYSCKQALIDHQTKP